MIKILRFLKPFRVQVAIVLFLVLLQSLANLYLPTLMADIVDNGVMRGDTGYIWRVGAVMLAITVAGTICAVIGSYYAARTAMGFARILRGKLFAHVQRFALHEFDTHSTASLITRTTNDTTQVQQVLIVILQMIISAPMMAIGGIILAINQDATLTWILVAVIPLVAIVFYLIMRRAIPLFQVMQRKIDKLNLVLDEALTGVRVIRAFDRSQYEQRRFDIANADLTDTAITVNRIVAVLFPAMMLILNLTTIAIFWFGSVRINNGDMQVGSLIAFVQYATQILFAMLMVSIMFVVLPRASASADRINAVLDTPYSISDPSQPQDPSAQRGYVEFDNVTFRYPGAEEPALSGVSFSAMPGQVTAIIGGTGSGKSTLISLIPRFYDVQSGSVRVDGVDVRDIKQTDLREKIGLVPQTPVLFTGTVRDNILFGNQSASDEDVQHAAQVAQAMEFITTMPDGFDSVIAQGGTNVSGGQKQRLSIARALVRRPEIYIFDDSFSALDFKTDAKLRMALRPEIRGSTVLIVAQRISTVIDADQIIVLDDGRTVGIGTHRELMNSCEPYREIVASQLAEEEIA